MNQRNERNNFEGNLEESGNNKVSSHGANDFGEAAAAGTFNGAVAGAMIGAQYGLIGTVIGGVSGGAIGDQIVEGAEIDDKTASKKDD